MRITDRTNIEGISFLIMLFSINYLHCELLKRECHWKIQLLQESARTRLLSKIDKISNLSHLPICGNQSYEVLKLTSIRLD